MKIGMAFGAQPEFFVKLYSGLGVISATNVILMSSSFLTMTSMTPLFFGMCHDGHHPMDPSFI